MISSSDLTSSDRPLCSFVSFVVNGFSASMIVDNFGIAGNSWPIGVKA